jgi:hypothetical protein
VAALADAPRPRHDTMTQFSVIYDKKRDTLYVSQRGTRSTLNFIWGIDETLRLDPDTLEVAGWTITAEAASLSHQFHLKT